MNWKDQLNDIKKKLPKHRVRTAVRGRINKEEVVTKEITEYVRVSDKVVRKREKSISI